MDNRILVWFSCGAASACAAKLATEKYKDNLEIIYCDSSAEEHEDNLRFRLDVERWIDRWITNIKSKEFTSPTDVFQKTRYMSGPMGARCTTELKKIPRKCFQWPDDVHIFGYTADEGPRIKRFEQNNPELRLEWILRDNNITKSMCYQMIADVGIDLPVMYKIGYRNNNCKGCVKASSPGYWNKVRTDFPDIFESRCKVSRELGVRLVEIKHHQRIFLDELPVGVGKYKGEDLPCGPECGIGV